MSDIGRFLSRCGESVTRQAITFGAPNGTTKWPAITYAPTTILAYFEPIASRNIDAPAGVATDVRLKMSTATAIVQRDRIVRGGVTYEVETDPTKHDAIRGMSYYTASLIKVS